jgi:hypothetical protein
MGTALHLECKLNSAPAPAGRRIACAKGTA